MKQFNPVHDRILIKPADPDKYVAGLELIGNDVQDKAEGEVISVGTGVPLHNVKLEVTGEVNEAAMDKLLKVVELIERGRQMRVKPGDYVLYGKYAGTKVTIDEVNYVIVRENDVFGTLRDSEQTPTIQ